MDLLKELEHKKLLKEAKYWREDFFIKKDMTYSMEIKFNNALSIFLDNNPSLKEKWEYYNDKKSKAIDAIIDSVTTDPLDESTDDLEFDIDIVIENVEPTPKDIELKRIYREIVKKTHPDKLLKYSEDEKENKIKIYKTATEYYNKMDFNNIIYCADDLDIKYDISLIELDTIKKDIERFKQHSMSFENSIYWKWYSDNMNETVLKQYLEKQLS